MTATTAGPAVDRYAESLHAADAVARQLRATAAERDRANQPPRAEIELLREHDLLQVQEPAEFGGAGQGARATSSAYGFDRHWRNVRTHTVHDPVAYKAREVGDWVLNRRAPEFSLYR